MASIRQPSTTSRSAVDDNSIISDAALAQALGDNVAHVAASSRAIVATTLRNTRPSIKMASVATHARNAVENVVDDFSDWKYPSGLRNSLSYWWQNSASSASEVEASLLRRGLEPHDVSLQTIEDQTSPTTSSTATTKNSAVLKNVPLGVGQSKQYLHTLEMPCADGHEAKTNMPIVVMHGYGGGLAFFWNQLTTMASLPGTKTYFLDMLGMGMSGRPSFPNIKVGNRKSETDVHSRVTQAENFFVDSLESYRKYKEIEKMTLVGHSLGGYLSVAYALRHPTRVHKLILISPVGVPESPYAKEGDADPEQVLAQELQSGPINQTNSAIGVNGRKPKAPNAWWTKLWEANISPFQLVRYATVYGPNLVSVYAARRFALHPNDVQRDLFQYLYQICRGRGSGEYALAHLLAPGAYARWPLVERIQDVQCPVTFIYGDNDWMDVNGGRACLEVFKSQPDTPQNASQKAQSRLHINEHAGHWTFLDNPDGFNSIILKELKEGLKEWKQ